MRKFNRTIPKYPYINKYTGAVYATYLEALKDAFSDFYHYPLCRTLKIFSIGKTEEA